MPRIGVDLGGTKIEGIVLETDGRIGVRERLATPAGDYPATLAAVAGLVDRLEARCGCRCSVGIGTPGSLSPATGRLRNANSTCLNDRPLDVDLAARLGRPVRIANDADCFALSEASDGAACDVSSVFGVIIGTGTGGGIVIDGKLLHGPNAISGEWGHNPCPGQTTTSVRAPAVTAASKAASRPFSPARDCRATTRAIHDCPPGRSHSAPLPASRPPMPAWDATKTASRAAWRA